MSDLYKISDIYTPCENTRCVYNVQRKINWKKKYQMVN